MDVFISHASEDTSEVAMPLKAELEKQGVEAWIDREHLMIGDNVPRRVGEAFEAGEFVVALISRAFLRKAWPMRELEAAIAAGRDVEEQLLPVLIDVTWEEVSQICVWLTRPRAVEWKGNAEAIANEITRKVRREKGGRGAGGNKPKEKKRMGPPSERDIRKFAKETLAEIKTRVRTGLEALEDEYEGFEFDLEEGTDGAFDARAYPRHQENLRGFFLWNMMGTGKGTIAWNDMGVGTKNMANGQMFLEQGDRGVKLSWHIPSHMAGKDIYGLGMEEAAEAVWEIWRRQLVDEME